MIVQETGNISSDDVKQSKKNEGVASFDFSKLMKIVRIMGLMALISYIAVILFTWIYANSAGHIYFSAGEPSLTIKYSEWILGFMAFFVAIYYFLMELSGSTCEGATKP
jgi:hypothetical protein